MFFSKYKEQFEEIKEAVEEDDSLWDIITDYEEVNDHTVWKLLTGIGVFSLIAALIIHLLVRPDVYYVRGFYIGVLLACFMVIDMDLFNNYAVSGPQHLIKRRLWMGYISRLFVVIGVMVAGLIGGYADVVMMLIGIMELKLSVYCKPVWDRVFTWFTKGNRQ